MGMFDTVIVEGHDLPDGWVADRIDSDFQTKAFDREMTTYKIAADGRLYVKRWEDQPTGKWYEFEGKGDNFKKVFCDAPTDESSDGISGPYMEYERVNERWDDVNFHGVFNFYSFESDLHEKRKKGYDGWHEYDAKFTNGQLDEIYIDQERAKRRRLFWKEVSKV